MKPSKYNIEQFTPLGERIIVERIEPPSEQGGIVLPDAAVALPTRARVLSVPGDAQDVKPGDVVHHDTFAGVSFSLSKIDDYLILEMKDVTAIITPDAAGGVY